MSRKKHVLFFNNNLEMVKIPNISRIFLNEEKAAPSRLTLEGQELDSKQMHIQFDYTLYDTCVVSDFHFQKQYAGLLFLIP